MWSTCTMADSIGSRIRVRRDLAGLSLRQLSERSAVTLTQIHKYERGVHEPTVPVLKRLAEALEVPLDELVP